jgi:hypothetical protein
MTCNLIPEDDLQRVLYTLHNNTEQFGMKILPLKNKVMVFKGQIPVISKTAIDDIILTFDCRWPLN